MTNFTNKSTTNNQIHLTVHDETRINLIKDFKKIVMNSGEYKDYTEGFFTAIKEFNDKNKKYLNSGKK